MKLINVISHVNYVNFTTVGRKRVLIQVDLRS